MKQQAALLCQPRAARIAACEVYALLCAAAWLPGKTPSLARMIGLAAGSHGVSRLAVSWALADISTTIATVAL